MERVDLGKSDAARSRQYEDAADGKTGGIFTEVKALVSTAGDQAAVRTERRRGIPVIRVEPTYVHPELFLTAIGVLYFIMGTPIRSGRGPQELGTADGTRAQLRRAATASIRACVCHSYGHMAA